VPWLDTVVQGLLLGGLYALFATGLSLAFGVMRAVRTGNDLRYVWVALASLSTAIVVARASERRPTGAAARAAWVFIMATLVAVFVAWLLGTRVGTGSLLVAAAFGFCYAAGSALK
jgi:branched-subunit amino acid ABC-type transport system permease component